MLSLPTLKITELSDGFIIKVRYKGVLYSITAESKELGFKKLISLVQEDTSNLNAIQDILSKQLRKL